MWEFIALEAWISVATGGHPGQGMLLLRCQDEMRTGVFGWA